MLELELMRVFVCMCARCACSCYPGARNRRYVVHSVSLRIANEHSQHTAAKWNRSKSFLARTKRCNVRNVALAGRWTSHGVQCMEEQALRGITSRAINVFHCQRDGKHQQRAMNEVANQKWARWWRYEPKTIKQILYTYFANKDHLFRIRISHFVPANETSTEETLHFTL